MRPGAPSPPKGLGWFGPSSTSPCAASSSLQAAPRAWQSSAQLCRPRELCKQAFFPNVTVKLEKNQSKQTLDLGVNVCFPSPHMLQVTAALWEHSSCSTAMFPFKRPVDDLHRPWQGGLIAPLNRRGGHLCFPAFKRTLESVCNSGSRTGRFFLTVDANSFCISN